MTQHQTKAIDFQVAAARRACGFRTREIMEATGLSRSAAHARVQHYEWGRIDLDDLFRPRVEAHAVRKCEWTVAGHTVADVMAATGLSYNGAARRMRCVQSGELPPEALLESRNASYRRRGVKIAEHHRRQPAGDKRGEWGDLGTRARNAALSRIPDGTPWERANL